MREREREAPRRGALTRARAQVDNPDAVMKKMRDERAMSPRKLEELRELFHLCDADGNGSVSPEELFNVLRDKTDEGGGVLTLDQISKLVSMVDENENAELEWDEFIEMMKDVWK